MCVHTFYKTSLSFYFVVLYMDDRNNHIIIMNDISYWVPLDIHNTGTIVQMYDYNK